MELDPRKRLVLEAVVTEYVRTAEPTLTRVLVVAILSSGEVRHNIVDFGQSVPAARLTRLERLLNEQLSGLNLNTMRRAGISLPEDMASAVAPAARVMEALTEMTARDEQQDAVVEGTTQVLRQPEFQDEERRERLLDALENRRALLESLRAMDEGVDVMIGSENPLPGLRELSFVSTRYYVGMSMSGVIGVFGPTRMAYSHAVPAVRATARALGDVLTKLSVE
jgi:heat-inducible transcriptional repressor